MTRYSREPYKLNLYYPLPRKSRSTNLSFPAQMCSLSNSDQKKCMGIALHHAGNKDTLTCQKVTYILRKNSVQKYAAKSLCHKIRSKIYYPKIWMQNMPPKFHASWLKNMLQNVISSKLDAKSSKIFCCQNLYH